MSVWTPVLSLPSPVIRTRTRSVPVLRGANVTAALPPLSRRRSCAAGGATASASPPLLSSSSWCCVARCWRPSSSTGTLWVLRWAGFRPPPCVTAPTDCTSAGGLGSRLLTRTQSSPAAAFGESGRTIRARGESTAGSRPPGGPKVPVTFERRRAQGPHQCLTLTIVTKQELQ